MNPLFSTIKAYRFNERAVAILLFAVSVCAFGLLIPRLGFYWDDWPTIFIAKMEGLRGFWQFFTYDRPSSAWFYMLLMPVLGTSPLPWHVYILLMRWLTTLMVWLTARSAWPNRPREAMFIALLFAVSPGFTQQPIAVTYSLVWTQYALYLLSWYCMIAALRAPARKRILLAGGAVSLLLSHSLSEYFFGLELLRPFIIWKVLSEDNPPLGPEKRRAFLLSWLPFVIVDFLYVLWRTFLIRFFLNPDAVRLEPKLLDLLVASPLAGLWRLVQLSVPDVAQALVGTWAETFNPSQFNFGQSISFVSAGVALLVGALTVYFLARVRLPETAPASPRDLFVRQAILFGLAATVLGSAPAWVIERQATIGRFADRFALVAMLGACIVLVGILSWFTQRDLAKAVVIGLLVMLGINVHINIQNDYRHAWERERLFYWQLYWRVPQLAAGTPIIADSEVMPYAGLYSTSLGISMIYSSYADRSNLDYWVFTADDNLEGHLPAYQAGHGLRISFRAWRFTGKSNEAMALSNAADQCLHVLGPRESDLAGAPAVLQPYLARSDLSRIILDESQRPAMPTDVFGSEPEHSWCYYYEKGALAAQQGAWQAAADLERQAKQAGLKPADPWEWLAFIEAGIRTNDFAHARDLTVEAYREGNDLGPTLCGLWSGLASASSSPDFQKNLAEVRASLSCTP